LPHHVTQRGNRREPIFFEDGDRDLYCDLLAEQSRRAGVEIWAYCLMPNHVHLIMVPTTADGLASAIGETHRRYASFINARARWNGHLFQGRYASVVMDEGHLIAAARYVSLNPVRARLVPRAQDWAWSSVRAHLKGEDDGLVVVRPLLDRIELRRADRRRAGRRSTFRCAAEGAPGLGSHRPTDRNKGLRRGPRTGPQTPPRTPRPRPQAGDQRRRSDAVAVAPVSAKSAVNARRDADNLSPN
jgi:putative transposase